MRRQLNTLYVTTEGAWLRKDGANIVMEVEGQVRGYLQSSGRSSADIQWHQRLLPRTQREIPCPRRRACVWQRAAAPRAISAQ